MHQTRISTNQVSSVVLGPKKLEIREKNCENCKRAEKKPPTTTTKTTTKYCAMKLSQICRRTELSVREIIPRFEMNLQNLHIHIRIFKQVPKYLATGLLRPLGTCSPPAEASTQGLKNEFLYRALILCNEARITLSDA
jgi:hypothetical protein